jgi:hypothetical protein
VRRATADVYAATIDDKLAMKIGPGTAAARVLESQRLVTQTFS